MTVSRHSTAVSETRRLWDVGWCAVSPLFTDVVQCLGTPLLEIKKSVDEGARLSDYDLNFLQEVLTDAQNVAPMVANHPELGALASKLTTLYREITETALANEKAD